MPKLKQPEVVSDIVNEVITEFQRDPSPITEAEKVGISALVDPFTRWINLLQRLGFAPKVVDDLAMTKVVLKTTKIPPRQEGGEPRKQELAIRQSRPYKHVYVRKAGGVPGPIPKGVAISFY